MEIERRLTLLANGDVVDAVVGYRSWLWNESRGVLRSTSFDNIWPIGEVFKAEPMGQLINETELAHTWATVSRSGIYAWRAPEWILSETVTRLHVWGEIEMWGTVHVHETGYRADYARIAALFARPVTHEDDDWARGWTDQAAEAYDVPLVQYPKDAYVLGHQLREIRRQKDLKRKSVVKAFIRDTKTDRLH